MGGEAWKSCGKEVFRAGSRHPEASLMCFPFETTSFWSRRSCKDVLARPDEPLAKILGIKRDSL